MSQISDVRNPWRSLLMSEPASFRGVIFHVESGSRGSGRREALHEYPKRNNPYAEDMGRAARRFSFSGYLIYRPSNPIYEYTSQRQRLYEALEADDAGSLVHPVFCAGGMSVLCLSYSMMENRERGGYTQFEMQFVESGAASAASGILDTFSNVLSQATSLESALTSALAPLQQLIR